MSFPATRLSVVERTRSPEEETRRVGWATIIEAYWKPVYKYLRMKWSLGPEEAADLTQEFFTTTLEKDLVERYDQRPPASGPTCGSAWTAWSRMPGRPNAA